jgi:hypothetical protein
LDKDDTSLRPAFFALERPAAGSVPVYESMKGTARVLEAGHAVQPPGAGEPIFYALPADAEDPPATTVPLREIRRPDGSVLGHSTGAEADAGAATGHSEQTICRVWKNPLGVALPRD